MPDESLYFNIARRVKDKLLAIDLSSAQGVSLSTDSASLRAHVHFSTPGSGQRSDTAIKFAKDVHHIVHRAILIRLFFIFCACQNHIEVTWCFLSIELRCLTGSKAYCAEQRATRPPF